jgi:hypothetical protein
MTTSNTVTVYDLATREIWDHLSPVTAASELRSCRAGGERVQEYETTDRAGAALTVALVVCEPHAGTEPIAAVYQFTTAASTTDWSALTQILGHSDTWPAHWHDVLVAEGQSALLQLAAAEYTAVGQSTAAPVLNIAA